MKKQSTTARAKLRASDIDALAVFVTRAGQQGMAALARNLLIERLDTDVIEAIRDTSRDRQELARLLDSAAFLRSLLASGATHV